MDLKKSTRMLDMENIMYVMLENLKSNGTFDEFRRHCISDIDAKPTYQNWKQRIESHVKKFLSKVDYTPELNKNTIRERLRKHLLDGREAHDIEEGADRVVTQLLVPRTLSGFEPKLEMAVNEYLGIKNQTPPKEQNGLKDSGNNLKNISRVEMSKIVSNSKRDLASEADNVENVDEASPAFEPLGSVLDNDNSNDESVSGMSDLASVGSPVQLVSKKNHDTTSNGFESDKNLIEKPLLEKPLSDVNGITNHKNDSTNIKPNDVPKILNNTEKLKTNNSKPPKSKHSSKASVHSNSQEKSSSHRSKDHNSNSHCSSSQEKNDIKTKSSSSSKDRKSSNNSKHHSSNSKDRKHKDDKKSHHSDHDKTPKRDRKNSRSDKKEKSSSLCKEPKLLNGNRSDDDNNAGGSSKQKSNLHKNKSSTSDKSKSSSSNHKSSRKDNSSKEVVDKSKDRSSVSKNSSTSGQKNSQNVKKSHKQSIEEKNKLDIINSNVEEKKPKLTDLRSSNITNDEQDAVNILLSISEIPYESPHKDIRTENSSPTIKIKKIPFNITENELEISDQTDVPKNSDQKDFPENSNQKDFPENSNQTEGPENSNQTKIIHSSNKNNVKQNVNVQTYSSETNSYDSLCEKKVVQLINHSFENVCSVETERHPLLYNDQKLQNSSVQNNIITEHNELAKAVIDEIEEESLNHEINLNSSNTQNISEYGSSENLKVSKLKLKRLPDQKSPIEKNKRKKHHKIDETKIKKLKKSKSYVLSCDASVPVIDTVSTVVVCENKYQESNCGPDIKNNDPVTTFSNKLLREENENKSIPAMDSEEYTFKGFSETELVQCKSYYNLKNLIESLQQKKNNQIKIENAGFRGFTDVRPCEKRNILHSQIIESRENLGFRGFSEEEVQFSPKLKLAKEQLELAKKQNNYEQKTMPSGKNVLQNGKKINEVVAIVYESNKDNPAPGEVCSKKKNENGKKDRPAVNNNNHDITTTEEWVVEQEMKYKLLPVKVKIERLLEYRCNGESTYY